MNDLKLNQLRYFCEVYDTGSVTAAAENLHITQPSVSATLKTLETAYSLVLFYRERNRLIPTKEGTFLYEKAKEILRRADDLDEKLRSLKHTNQPIRIGVSPMISTFLFLPVFNRFHSRFPEISLEMHESGSIESVPLLQKHEIDMAIIIENNRATSDFIWKPLMHTKLLFCVSRKHHLANAEKVRVEELESERLIMMRATSYQIGTLVNRRFFEAGIVPNVLLQSNQIALIRQYIRSYNAGAFLMEAFVQQCMKNDDDIVGIPLDPPIDISIGLIRNYDDRFSQNASIFYDFLSDTFEGEDGKEKRIKRAD